MNKIKIPFVIIKVSHFLMIFKPIRDLFTKKIFENQKRSLKNLTNYLEEGEIVKIPNTLDIKNLKIALVYEPDKYNDSVFRYNFFKYERFLKKNNIHYKVININKSGWVDEFKGFTHLIWAVSSKYSKLYESHTKIKLIEDLYKIKCFPSFDLLWSYEDKVRMYYILKNNGINVVNTFISFDEDEVFDNLDKFNYPLVSKISTGSGSRGVDLVKSKRQLKSMCNKIFTVGLPTYNTFIKQHNYVYLQDFIEDATKDIRVIVVGDKVFGYSRLRPKNDFRASGAGLYEKEALPDYVIKEAIKVRDVLNAYIVAVDFVDNPSKNTYLVIEASIFFGIDTPEQLKVNGKPGYYLINKDGTYNFVDGKYWVQELSLVEFFIRNTNRF